MRPRLFFTDHIELPLPPGHRFPILKYQKLREKLAGTGVFDFEPAPLASPADVERAHDPAYVRAFLAGELPAAALRRIGFPWSEGLVRRTLASVGGTLAASRLALERGWGGTLAGGTHHAFRSEGSGFCVFNDIAVAILALRAEARIEKAAVIDLDVHQGDGTALIFAADPSVLTVSMHGKNNFPFRKQTSRIDVELPDRTADEYYLEELRRVLPSVWEFGPQVIFYQSGVDALGTDKLGRLALTPEGLAERDRTVLEGCFRCGAPTVITLGGGYSDPIEITVEAHARTYLLAAGTFGSG